MDETEADDGGMYHFWSYIERLRLLRDHPDFADRLEDDDAIVAAVAAFDTDEATP